MTHSPQSTNAAKTPAVPRTADSCESSTVKKLFVAEVLFVAAMLLIVFGLREWDATQGSTSPVDRLLASIPDTTQPTSQRRPRDDSSEKEPPPAQKPAPSKPDQQTSNREGADAKKRSSAKAAPSYAYLGTVSQDIPEVQSFESASETVSSSSPASQRGQGDSQRKEKGQIPELTINADGPSLRAAADRFGYQMVAMDTAGTALLGKLDPSSSRLSSITRPELSAYAGRARSANRHPRYNELRQFVARNSRYSTDEITLIYLVPKEIERRFVDAQMEAIRQRGLQAKNVAVVNARYTDHSITVTGVELKSDQPAP